tara:strand:- start:319 stop:435 length:117 start_codon:yes stop_codon:yes gene_type:complete
MTDQKGPVPLQNLNLQELMGVKKQIEDVSCSLMLIPLS